MAFEFFRRKQGKETDEQKTQKEAKEFAGRIVDIKTAEKVLENLEVEIRQLNSEVSTESLNASMDSIQSQSYGDDMFEPGGRAFEQQTAQVALDEKNRTLESLEAERSAVFQRMHELEI